MAENESITEILKRKYEPFTDWKPVCQCKSAGGGFLDEALEEAKKGKESIEKFLEPLTEDARKKIRDAASTIEEVAEKSSREARSFLAKSLETLAGKIKP
jgi:hypothetical protein